MIAVGHTLRDFDLLRGVQKRHLADFLEVHADRVVDGNALVRRGDAFDFRKILRDVLGDVDVFHDVNVERLKLVVNALDLLGIKIEFVKGVHDLFVGQNALVFAVFQKLFYFFCLGFLVFQSCPSLLNFSI